MSQPIVYCPRCYEPWHLGPCRGAVARWLAVVALALAACSPSPAPVHPDAAGDAAPPVACDPGSVASGEMRDCCPAACANLAALGCAEGLHPACISSCQRSPALLGVDIRPACVSAARSKVEVRDCGGGVVSCH